VLRWLVINDPAKVHQVAALTIDWMKSTQETNPALYHEAKGANPNSQGIEGP